MTTLEDAALAFARECLAWSDARAVHTQDPQGRPRFVVCSPTARENTLFTPSDLAEVRAATQAWCATRDLTIELVPETKEQPAHAVVSHVGGPAGDGVLNETSGPSAAHAMLAACVVAHQTLRAGA